MSDETEETFFDKLAIGEDAELLVARILLEDCPTVKAIMPLAAMEAQKRPEIWTKEEQVPLPDLQVWNQNNVMKFVDCKLKRGLVGSSKTESGWAYHPTAPLATGVDLHHFQSYYKLSQTFDTEVYLMFIHINSGAHGEDGVFYTKISEGYDRVAAGMVWWNYGSKKLYKHPLSDKIIASVSKYIRD